MDQIGEHINSSNRKIYSYDQMSKMIFNSGSNKVKIKDNFFPQLTHLQNSLLMSIFNTPERDLSNFDGKTDMRNYVHLQWSCHQHYFLVQYVQCIIALIVIKANVSCWSYTFLRLIHWLFQRYVVNSSE